MKRDHINKRSRKHTQPAKKMNHPWKFCVKEIYRFTSFKVTCNTKYNSEKVNILLREDLKIAKRKIKKIKCSNHWNIWSYFLTKITINFIIKENLPSL